MVRLSVLGPLRAEVADCSVELGSPRQRAVLARLVSARGHVVSTERFVDDLWQGEPPPKALAALQVYVSHLRRVLEPGRAPRTPARVLVSAAPGYALRLDDDGVDAWRFEQLLERAAAAPDPADAITLLDQALAQWSGPAYAEFADEPWALPEAERLEELRRVTSERRARAMLAVGRNAEAVADLDLHVRAHPLREDAVALLALALYRTGRQAEALATLREARTRLADELGVDPGPALRALEADVLAQSPSLDAAPIPATAAPIPAAEPSSAAPSPPASAMADARLIVGRDIELARLTAAADRAAAGEFRVTWVGGEPGAGKSTLAAALTTALADAGWQVLRGRCPEVDGAPPAWAWSEVVRALVEEIDDDLATRLAPLLRQEPSAPTSAVPPFWLGRAVAELLATLSGSTPLLVVLDDVHRADDETLQLLRHVASELVGRPVLVVGTYRPAEVTDELRTCWAALAGPHSDRLDLAGLAADDVAELLRRQGAPTDPELVELVTRRTGGNPLFVSETGRLIAAEGPAAAAHAVPAGVRDVLRRRLARLPGPARAVLRTASVLGVDVDVDVLLALESEDEEQVLDALEAGVVTGLLVEPPALHPPPSHPNSEWPTSNGLVRFAHALVRDTLYEDIPRLRRTRLHGRALAALESVHPGDRAGLAHHALAAATPATAARAAVLAADAARAASALSAYQEAASLLRRALDALDLDDRQADAGLRLDLLRSLVSAQAYAGNVLESRLTRLRAIAVAEQLGDPIAVAEAYASFDAPAIWSVRENRTVDQPFVDGLEKVLQTLPADDAALDDLRCRLLATLTIEVEGSAPDLAARSSDEALATARRLGDPELLCRVLSARYYVAVAPDRRHELAVVGAELRDVASGAGLTGYRVQGHHILFQVALSTPFLDTLDPAQYEADRAVEYSSTGQLGLALGVVRMFSGLRALVRGAFDEAANEYGVVIAYLRELGAPNAGGVGNLTQYAVARAIGGAEGAARLRELVEPVGLLNAQEPHLVSEPYTRLLLHAGRIEEARAAWRPDWPVPPDYYWLLWMAYRAENALGLDAADVVASTYRTLLPHTGLLPGMSSGSITLGPLDSTLGDLAAYLGDPDAAHRHYRDAVRVAELLGAPHWVSAGRERLELLARWRRDGGSPPWTHPVR
ncbi:AfsR/SARP family transcriptional regulator [Cryptosporangium aurantiacum]|uniref:Transcriptional regulatory protein, C terminal n=1 Tax=Cryptosporangium aurantiacum TaxID=134849 RepID=A0A1M7MS63_9ACTN|nr:AfsR/SARP family transcriptional regulator [Cryptosporangium aurantiacum]SHM93915.1 Transcriptional regulatory protein, C terminal [Cryptosporangium aurantiacum]